MPFLRELISYCYFVFLKWFLNVCDSTPATRTLPETNLNMIWPLPLIRVIFRKKDKLLFKSKIGYTCCSNFWQRHRTRYVLWGLFSFVQNSSVTDESTNKVIFPLFCSNNSELLFLLLWELCTVKSPKIRIEVAECMIQRHHSDYGNSKPGYIHGLNPIPSCWQKDTLLSSLHKETRRKHVWRYEIRMVKLH